VTEPKISQELTEVTGFVEHMQALGRHPTAKVLDQQIVPANQLVARRLELPQGAPWCDLPERFGDWKNTHKRFSRWAESGLWGSLFKTLADDLDTVYAMIDATIVRAHQHSARGSKKGDSNEAIGRSRGGLTTKIHAIVDALGNPLAVSLTGGHVHDVTQAQVLPQEIEPAALLADKGYDY
jgi:transposase